MGRFSPLPVSYATACVTLKSHTSAWCVTVCHSSKNIFVPLQSSVPIATRGSFVGPTKKASSPTNWNNKHYKLAVFVKILDVKPPCTNAKTLIEDFLTTVLQSSMEDRKKLVIHLRSTWMTDRIRYFPVVQKQYFTNILHPGQCGKDSCHPPLNQQLPTISFLSQWII